MNLLSNAADAVRVKAKANGKIRVDVEASPVDALRSQSMITDRVFRRISKPNPRAIFHHQGGGQGNGPGDAGVLRILDNHGMKLEILDAPELGGARFDVAGRSMSPISWSD